MVFSNIDELAALARGGAVMLSKLLANHNAQGQLTNSRFVYSSCCGNFFLTNIITE